MVRSESLFDEEPVKPSKKKAPAKKTVATVTAENGPPAKPWSDVETRAVPLEEIQSKTGSRYYVARPTCPEDLEFLSHASRMVLEETDDAAEEAATIRAVAPIVAPEDLQQFRLILDQPPSIKERLVALRRVLQWYKERPVVS